jgi:hypothetical protein
MVVLLSDIKQLTSSLLWIEQNHKNTYLIVARENKIT